MHRIFTRWKNKALDLVFPNVCLGCKQAGTLLCGKCRSLLHWIPPTCIVCRKFVPAGPKTPAGRTCAYCQKKSFIYAFLSPFSYDSELVRGLIHTLKYSKVTDLGVILGKLLAEYIRKYGVILPKDILLVPLPLHKSRERTRGFNQSLLIAQNLAQEVALPLEANALKKTKKTKAQVEFGAEERRKNIVGTFGVSDPLLVKDREILLLDDVKTTGATLEEAGRVLKEAGAKRVWAITVAH